ncbi:MAG: zinc-binding dehydrogenase [Clostridia bacterium]
MKGYGIKKINEPMWLTKDKPVAGPLDAIVRPVVLAPCTSDVHASHGGSGEQSNLILGHEAIGEVTSVGNLVTNFKKGDIVVVPCTTPDWMAPGVQGKFNAHDRAPMGSFKFLSQRDGTFAEFFTVNHADANLVLLPDGVKPEAALMVVDMMSTGFHGVEQADIGFGDTVVVIGIGPVGLMAIAGSKLKGAGRIIAIGSRPNCVKIAKEYGATDIVNYKEGDIVAQVRELTGGFGADKVIIAGGNQDSFGQAVAMTAAGGTVSNVNFFDVKDVLSMPAYVWSLGMGNIEIKSGFCPGGALRMHKMLEMIRYGRVDTTKLISHTFHGFEKIEDAFLLMDKKPADLIKPVVFID